MSLESEWSLETARRVYRLRRADTWYLDLNEDGELCLVLDGRVITFSEIINRVADQLLGNVGAAKSDFHVPSFTLRIPQLIERYVKKLRAAFDDVFQNNDYGGSFLPVYPIKVNPMKTVVKTILKSDSTYGLEAGTKSELLLILKELRNERHRLVVCNGVKDNEYMNIVKVALEQGYRVWVSVESVEETIMALEMIPLNQLKLILRLKPYVKLHGHWGDSTGRNARFGLGIHELKQVMSLLKTRDATRCVVAVHAHPGSQLVDPEDFREHALFLANAYRYLRDAGFKELRVINLGGGMPINYEGSLPEDSLSTIIDSIVKGITEVLNGEDTPDLMVEYGRFITAAWSIILVDILDAWSTCPMNDSDTPLIRQELNSLKDRLSQSKNIETKELLRIWKTWCNEIERKISEMDFDKLYDRELLFYRAKQLMRKIFVLRDDWEEFHDDPHVKELLAPDWILLGNFSVFNSVCDFILVRQYFPMIPIKFLNQRPESIVRLIDITCDSDGEISIFSPLKHEQQFYTKDYFPLTTKNKKVSLNGFPVGNVLKMKGTHVAIALVGAYQDIIEFDHNLIGDLPDVEIHLKDDGEWEVKVIVGAQSIKDLVKEVGYDIPIDSHPYIKRKRP